MTTYDNYPFLLESEELISFLSSMSNQVGTFINSSGILSRARRSYNYAYGRMWRSNDGSRLGSAGEQGELMTMATNHFRNILLHTLAIVTQQRLVFDCQSESTDVNARNATIIGNMLLEQQFYEKQIDKHIHRAVEMGLFMGTAFLTIEWDPYDKLLGIDGEGTPIYTGAPKVKAHSMFDVVWCPWKDDDEDQQWVQVREMINRWDLIALFPEKTDEIKALPKITDIQLYDPYYRPEEDHVFLYKVYHKETPALPSGRMLWYCDKDVVLYDGINPYIHLTQPTPNKGLPVFCFRPAIQYATYAGHSIAFDLMPLQEALNILDSSIITNQQNFATQNIAVPKESSITTADITGGCKLIEYSVLEGVPGGGKPEPLMLCATPPEVFTYREKVVQGMEMLSGINSVLRGQPQASLISGTALALVATQANTFNTTLEGNYIRFCEQSAHFLLHIISKFQKTEDLVALIGKGKSNEVKSFKGDDLAPIRKVKVSIGNPLAKTTAGKLEIAEKLLTAQLIKTPQEFLEVLQTGNIVNVVENETAEISYIKWENESFLNGESPQVLATDNHPLHILEHRTQTFNPDIRKDPQYHTKLLQHMQQHLDQFDVMASNNPTLLAMCTGQPIPMPQPAQGTGVGPQSNPTAPSTKPIKGVGSVGEANIPIGEPGSEQQVAMTALKSAANKLKASG